MTSSSNDHFWCIVKFSLDNAISMIPSTWWLGSTKTNEKGQIYWPKVGQYSKIKKQMPPGIDWDLYEGVMKMAPVIKTHEEGLIMEKEFEAMESGTEEEE